MQRYAEIADALIGAAYDPEVVPLFPGKQGRMRTMALVLSIAYHESGFRRDVDLGYGRARLARGGWNDYGRSWCMLQINLGRTQAVREGLVSEESASVTAQGWHGSELLADRGKCFRAGIEVLRGAMGACGRNELRHRLAAYASGTCDRGLSASEARMRNAIKVHARLQQLGWPNDGWSVVPAMGDRSPMMLVGGRVVVSTAGVAPGACVRWWRAYTAARA